MLILILRDILGNTVSSNSRHFMSLCRDYTPACPENSTALPIDIYLREKWQVLLGHISNCMGPRQPNTLVSVFHALLSLAVQMCMQVTHFFPHFFVHCPFHLFLSTSVLIVICMSFLILHSYSRVTLVMGMNALHREQTLGKGTPCSLKNMR